MLLRLSRPRCRVVPLRFRRLRYYPLPHASLPHIAHVADLVALRPRLKLAIPPFVMPHISCSFPASSSKKSITFTLLPSDSLSPWLASLPRVLSKQNFVLLLSLVSRPSSTFICPKHLLLYVHHGSHYRMLSTIFTRQVSFKNSPGKLFSPIHAHRCSVCLTSFILFKPPIMSRGFPARALCHAPHPRHILFLSHYSSLSPSCSVSCCASLLANARLRSCPARAKTCAFSFKCKLYILFISFHTLFLYTHRRLSPIC